VGCKLAMREPQRDQQSGAAYGAYGAYGAVMIKGGAVAAVVVVVAQGQKDQRDAGLECGCFSVLVLLLPLPRSRLSSVVSPPSSPVQPPRLCIYPAHPCQVPGGAGLAVRSRAAIEGRAAWGSQHPETTVFPSQHWRLAGTGLSWRWMGHEYEVEESRLAHLSSSSAASDPSSASATERGMLAVGL
jgi:hypothetical protein